MAKIVKSVVLPLDAEAIRADLLVQRETKSPRAVIRGMFDHQCVWVDGAVCDDIGFMVGAGVKFEIKYDPNMRYKEKPKARHSKIFDVVFEDDHLIVVNKHAGYLTVPNNEGDTNTVVDAVKTHVNRGNAKGKPVALVHRLDRDTSGLLIFGKNAKIGSQLKDQFADRKPERVYVAIVKGVLTERKGTIKSYLATDDDLNQRTVANAKDGKIAITHFEVEKVLKDATMIRVTLETGRRNQIRVHFSERGHPILGEQRYNIELSKHKHWPHKRLALHAKTLGLKHPVTQEVMSFRCEPPAEFKRFCEVAK